MARTLPKTKQLFVSSLKKIGCKVMMCGDGVNDVAALRESDLSVALLNGFSGLPSSLQRDIEDDRRRERWHSKNRMGLNASPTAAQIRIQLSMKEALDSSAFDKPKDIVSAFIYAMKKEIDRSNRLRDGGAKAAQVLAEDDRFFRSKSGANMEDFKTETTESIKSGEAFLAAKFSCLRPCIDGVDYRIRCDITASAFSLSLRRIIFLNSLMACFNLATLYLLDFPSQQATAYLQEGILTPFIV